MTKLQSKYHWYVPNHLKLASINKSIQIMTPEIQVGHDTIVNVHKSLDHTTDTSKMQPNLKKENTLNNKDAVQEETIEEIKEVGEAVTTDVVVEETKITEPSMEKIEVVTIEEPAKVESLPVEVPAPAVVEETITEPPKEEIVKEAVKEETVEEVKEIIEAVTTQEPAKIESLPVEIPAPEITETPAVVEETITEPPKEEIEVVTTQEPAKEVEVEVKNEVAEEDSKLKAEEVIKIEEVVEPVKEVSSE